MGRKLNDLLSDNYDSVTESLSEISGLTKAVQCCATNRKVAGSILAGVIGIFH